MKSSQVLSTVCLLASIVVAEAFSAEYAVDVAPLLQKYCAGCHNDDETAGDLSLATFAGLQRGGENGAVVVPGKAGESRLVRALNGADDLKMPPEDQAQLTAKEIDLIRQWVDEGARPPKIERPAPAKSRPLPARIGPLTVTSLAVSPVGDQYAVGSYRQVELFDAATDVAIRTLTGLPGKVTALHYSHDGEQIVVASGVTGRTGLAALFNTSDGQRVRTFAGHGDILYDAEISSDGSAIATCSYDRKIVLWDTATGKPQRTLEGHNDAVYDVAFSPDGSVLASASGDETIKVWDVRTGNRFDTMSQPQGEQYVVLFSPDGRLILAGGADNRIRAWHFRSRTEQQINPLAFARFAHDGAVTGLAFTQDGRHLVSAAADRSIKQWETKTLTQTYRFPSRSDQTTGLAMLPTTGELLVSQIDGEVERIPLETSSASAKSLEVPQEQDAVEATTELASTNRLVEHEPNDTVSTAMRVYLPATIEGTISAGGHAGTDIDLFRFSSRANEEWVLETEAARNESELDSFIEVWDAAGEPIPRVLLQATRDSYFTFRGKDSSGFDDFRLHNWEEMELNEYLYANGEVVRLWHYPRGPDSGFQVYPGQGKRYGFFDTTPIAHALHEPCFIVEPQQPGSPLVSNGLPVFTLYYENDDESRRELGADSRLTFRAPHDGEFLARLSDVRGFAGPDYRYKLTLRRRRPDFEVSLREADLSINLGSGKEFIVEAKRKDGFEGEIHLEVADLPPGFHASTPLVIERGQNTALGSLYTDPDATGPVGDSANAASITATAIIDGVTVRKEAISLGTIKLDETAVIIASIVGPDEGEGLPGSARSNELFMDAGETITAVVRIDRNGFEGRVGFGTADAGRNLPHGVFVDNIGLNGLLIVEGQDEREFFITAAPWVAATRRLFHLRTESEGNLTTRPIWLNVRSPKDGREVAEADSRRR